MKPDHWRKVDEIFEAALLREPERRAAFLDQACGSDRELRREVEKMLAIDDKAQDFIKTDVFDVAAKLITQPHESPSHKKSFTSDSIDDARFVPLEEAKSLLTYQRDVELLASVERAL